MLGHQKAVVDSLLGEYRQRTSRLRRHNRTSKGKALLLSPNVGYEGLERCAIGFVFFSSFLKEIITTVFANVS